MADNDPRPTPDLVCIVGMHRSGTSLVARIVNLLGLSLGPPEQIMGPKPDNPTGFWENWRIVRLNEALMRVLGAAWDHPVIPYPGWHDSPVLEPYLERAVSTLRTQFPETGLAGVKDPRLSFLMPFWRRVTDVRRTILVLRDPREVARSLETRNGLPLARGTDLWLKYVVSAALSEPDHLLIRYEEALADPRRTATDLAAYIGLEEPSEQVLHEIEAFADPSLRHERSTGSQQIPNLDLCLSVVGALEDQDREQWLPFFRAIQERWLVEQDLERAEHTVAELRFTFDVSATPEESRAPDLYHRWYYETGVWKYITWLGVPVWKAVNDLWNYQEILWELRPTVVIEFGTNRGGSALFFATVLEQIHERFEVVTVDIEPDRVEPGALADPRVTFLACSSTDPQVREAVIRSRARLPGPVFAILDSDHTKDHVLAEMELLTPLLEDGDYLVVEDTNINGHPVLPGWGPGPYEAVEEFMTRNPGTYEHDRSRESKFGFTFAPNGFLVRKRRTGSP